MYNHNKAQQSKNRVHISWDILYSTDTGEIIYAFGISVLLISYNYECDLRVSLQEFHNCCSIKAITVIHNL